MAQPVNGEIAETWTREGFVTVFLYDGKEQAIIGRFARNWVLELIRSSAKGPLPGSVDLAHYHCWWREAKVDHDNLFCAANRYCSPEVLVRNALINERLQGVLDQLVPETWRLWEEGLGWLGFRFVRPGLHDGYPPSCKAWGPAQNVVSLWIPVIGYSSQETLAVAPGSHIAEFERYLPKESKFCNSEYRLAHREDLEFHRPALRPGDAILYHPRLLHTEDVERSNVTRLNLEIRFAPNFET